MKSKKKTTQKNALNPEKKKRLIKSTRFGNLNTQDKPHKKDSFLMRFYLKTKSAYLQATNKEKIATLASDA